MITVKASKGADLSILFTAELNGRIVGGMNVSVLPMVHDMTLAPGMVRRKVLEALFQYASGYVKASGFGEALVMVADGNTDMQRWIEQKPVAKEPPAQAYMMPVE